MEPVETEEVLTTEADLPDTAIGQVFVMDLCGKTLTLDGITTKTAVAHLNEPHHHQEQCTNTEPAAQFRLQEAGIYTKAATALATTASSGTT